MGLLVNGKYYPDKNAEDAESNLPPLAKQARISKMTQEYDRHDIDLVQPYLPNGKPNPDFIKYYPEEAAEYGFTKKESELC